MSGPRYANLARKVLVRRDVAIEVAPPDARERESSIAAIERAIEHAARRRRVVRWGSSAAAVAAVLACVFGAAKWTAHRASAGDSSGAAAAEAVQIVAHPAAGGASLMGPGGQAPLVEGRSLVSGSRIVTPPNGQATLSFSTGTTASLGAGADLSIVEQGGSQILHLSGGSVDLHVAKLEAGQRFLVDTVDTEVEVRGTRFRVEVIDPASPGASCGGGIATRVSVTEGVVAVRHAGVEARVAAGDTWPAGCTPAPTASAGGRATSPAPAWAARVSKGGRSTTSDLAGQNDLFAEGTRARHRGDEQAALAAFDQLLARYPGGPLAEAAFVERMRVLRDSAPDRAVATAREYLARYPSGFARSEAEAVIQAGSP
jgi:hypothetical protein